MTAPRALTGNIVYNHFGHPCAYRIHRDLFASSKDRTRPTATGRYLMDRGNRHEDRVFRGIQKKYPDEWISIASDPDATDRVADIARRAEATRQAMSNGVRFIFHGIIERPALQSDEVMGAPVPCTDLLFRGETDILIAEKTDGEAIQYIVGDVKSSLHARFAQKMQVAFYSWILAYHYGAMMPTGFIITGEGTREDFATDDYYWTLKHFIEEEVHEFIDHGNSRMHLTWHCSGCHWKSHCEEKANNTDSLSLIPTCRRMERVALEEAGITTRALLLVTDEKVLRSLGRQSGTSLDCFRDLKKRATAQEFGRPIVNQHPKKAAANYVNGPPQLYHHNGPILLLSSITDHYHGDEVLMATSLLRREQLLKPEGRSGMTLRQVFPGLRPDSSKQRISELLAHLHEARELLVARNETLLVVITDEGMPNRLQRQAEGTPWEMAVETMLTDATVLPRLVRRTWFLSSPIRDIHDLAAELQKTPTVVSWSAEEDIQAAAIAALDDVAADYDLVREELVPGDRELRPLAVREWRASSEEHWQALLEYDLDRERAAASDIIAAVMAL